MSSSRSRVSRASASPASPASNRAGRAGSTSTRPTSSTPSSGMRSSARRRPSPASCRERPARPTPGQHGDDVADRGPHRLRLGRGTARRRRHFHQTSRPKDSVSSSSAPSDASSVSALRQEPATPPRRARCPARPRPPCPSSAAAPPAAATGISQRGHQEQVAGGADREHPQAVVAATWTLSTRIRNASTSMSKRAPSSDTVPVRRATGPSTASSTSATTATRTSAASAPGRRGSGVGDQRGDPARRAPPGSASPGWPGRDARLRTGRGPGPAGRSAPAPPRRRPATRPVEPDRRGQHREQHQQADSDRSAGPR